MKPAFSHVGGLTCFVIASLGCGENDNAADDHQGDSAADQSAVTEPPKPITAPLFFTDVTATSGIDLSTTAGQSPSTQILEVKGGGLGLIDYDNDGDLDLFIPNGATLDDPEHGPGCRLFENRGNFTFVDVTQQAGLTLKRWSFGVSVGDYNGDGHDDIFVACFGPNVLLRNTGDGRFDDVSQAAGIAHDGWATSSSFGDIDGDGDLDLYVVNYVHFDPASPPPLSTFRRIPVLAGPRGLPAMHDVLYENLGDGTFRDITESAGCLPPRAAYGLGAVIMDFNDDGRQDIFVGNDSMPNYLFLNQGDRRFIDAGMRSGIASNLDGDNQATMGIAVADVDGNGRPDVFTTNFSSDVNTLHLNVDGEFFDDRTQQYGLAMVSRSFVGWACGFYDFDHDADEDLLAVNGHVYPQATRRSMDSDYLQPPLLFERKGSRFERIEDDAAGAWLLESHCDRSAVFGDLDRDGDIDVIVSELNGPLRVLRNDAAPVPGNSSSWLIVELHDTRAESMNHRGLGSRLELTTGDRTQIRWILSGTSFQAASAQYAHFGLGGLSEADGEWTLTVIWADGYRQVIEGAAASQYLSVKR